MAYKLIAFDLDGTLLDDDKNIPEENLRALEAAAGQGILVVPATGRIVEGIPESVRRLPFIRYYISINGAYVYDSLEDKVLYRGEIPLGLALELIAYMDTLPVIYDCYQDNRGWMTGSMFDRAEEYLRYEPRMLELIRRLRIKVDSLPETLRQRGEPLQKLQMYFKKEDMEERSRQLRLVPELFPQLEATSSVSCNIEINSVSATKGKALAVLCTHLGLDLRDCIAFGDGTNDTDMLKAAGMGVAMANADEKVKAAADAVTGSNNAAGVAQMLRQLTV